MERPIEDIKKLLSRVTMDCLGHAFSLRIERDKGYTIYDPDRDNREFKGGRIFVQVRYTAPCTKGGSEVEWKGRKYYLSDYMTDDEIIKTAYVAFEYAVKHEIMEGFKVDGIILFNPHANFEALLEASKNEVKREQKL